MEPACLHLPFDLYLLLIIKYMKEVKRRRLYDGGAKARDEYRAWLKEDIRYNLKGTGLAQEVLDGKIPGVVESIGGMIRVFTGNKSTPSLEFNGYLSGKLPDGEYTSSGKLPDGRYTSGDRATVNPGDDMLDEEVKKQMEKLDREGFDYER